MAADDEDEQQRRREQGGEKNSALVLDPLAGLPEPERLALLIRFGALAGSKGGMCAAMSHGHSFQSSIFRLPAKCAACHELVWGPFTRGCTCLTCSVTVHRSCTGVATMPRCPTKDVFDAFCRSELGLPQLLPASPTKSAAGTATGSTSSSAAGSGSEDGAAKALGGAASSFAAGEMIGGGGALAQSANGGGSGGGDLEEWATVDGASGHSTSPAAETAASTSCAVHDLGSSFSWSPLGLGDRKRLPVSEGAGEGREHANHPPSGDAGDAGGSSSPGTTLTEGQEVSDPSQAAPMPESLAVPTTTTAAAAAADAAAASSSTCNKNVGIRGVTKMSVAGGVVGAFFGGPVGAVVGLKVGAVLGAGRSVQQGLWQRIEKSRRDAGAEGIGLPKDPGAAAAPPPPASAAEEEVARKPRDVWARIAQQVEREQQPAIWELDPEQQKLLEQGECDAGEVAMFVVGKVLADETAMLFHLHAALLAEFRSRHRSHDCARRSRPVPIRRRSSDTDMVAIFPRSSGSSRRDGAAPAAGNAAAPAAAGPPSAGDVGSTNNRSDPSSSDHPGGFFASTPGLEKTFSFVEEVEIVAGEGSDTQGDGGDEDEDGNSIVDGSGGDGSGSDEFVDGVAGRSGLAAPALTHSSHVGAAPAGSTAAAAATTTTAGTTAATSSRRGAAAAAAASKDSWRNASSRLESWVQLDGGGCSSCGGRVTAATSGGSSQGGQSTRAGARDVDEDEGGIGEGWASAEAPLCWCGDEGGLSASPEDAKNGLLSSSVSDGQDAGTGRGDEGVGSPAPSMETLSIDRGRLHDPQRQHLQNGGHRTADGGVDHDGGGGGDKREEEEDAFDALRDVHGVLRELTRAVLEWCPLLTASHDAQIQAVNCIDQRVFLETYGPVFGHIASSGAASDGDTSLARRVRREERSRAARGRPSLQSTCRAEVMSALRAAGAARTGRDKLGFLVQAVEAANDALPEQPTTDALIFSVCRHLAAATISNTVGAGGEGLGVGGGRGRGGGGEALGGDVSGSGDAQPALPRPHAEVAFVEQFMRDESWVMGKEGYVLTTVIAALHVLSDRNMSDDVFLDAPPAST
eukprot:g8336.t1